MPDHIDTLARDLAVAMPVAGDWVAFEAYIGLIANRVRECVKEQRKKHIAIIHETVCGADHRGKAAHYCLGCACVAVIKACASADRILAHEGR
jgi:hypothetical protein